MNLNDWARDSETPTINLVLANIVLRNTVDERYSEQARLGLKLNRVALPKY